jgi:carbamoyl-phosphate synthase large subunit
MEKILITGGGGSSVLYLANKLKKKYKILIADADPYCAGLNSGYDSINIPFGKDENFEKKLLEIIKEKEINYIVPCVDEELLKFWSIKEKNNIFELVLPNRLFVELCLNKKNLMNELRKKDISNIPSYTQEYMEFPLIAKPIYGRGSKEVHKLENLTQLKGYLDLYKTDFNSILLQKYIEGEEYTVSVIVNNKNNLIGIIPKKIILKKGITRIAITCHSELINSVCKKIIKNFNPCGPFNVQLKINKDKIHIFEINPRLSTTSVLTDYSFGNEIDLFIENLNKVDLKEFPKFEEGVIMARYEEAIFYKK